MSLSIQQLRTWFREFNCRYFGDELPEPRLVVSHARTQLGQFRCQRQRTSWLRKLSPFTTHHSPQASYTIKVSEYYDVGERELQNVLLHEMIHFYISYKGLRDTSAHGPEFRRIMQWLNDEHGWHITVSTNTKGWTVSKPYQQRQLRRRHVIAVETTDGHCYLGVVHADYVKHVDRQATRTPQVKSHRWFTTTDAYFADFPQSRTLRARRLKRADYEQRLRTLENEPHTVPITA